MVASIEVKHFKTLSLAAVMGSGGGGEKAEASEITVFFLHS